MIVMKKPLNVISMEQKAINDFMTYSTAVIKSRAIPSVEDGLKPVARRILYTMHQMKLTPTAKTIKSANVVGQCMVYHPHGDASIYDAMVRMSQDWKMRYPLTYIQGNNGSLNGDGPAHMRYTECRLSPAGQAILEGLDPDILKFVPNYDNSTIEPTILSGIFPNVLCNGTEGIAVGLSSSLVPHNFSNVCDLITAYINNPTMSIDEATRIIVGPDFPLGGTVIDGYKLKDIYAKGQGAITLRASAVYDEKKGTIMFSNFPYLVDVQDRIVKSIKDLVLEEGYTDILECENHIGKNSCYITVICQKGANLQKIVNDLYEKTPLQKTVKINNTVIYGGVPRTLSLLQLVNMYIMHRHSCIIKGAQKELAKQEHIIHIQEGLRVATASIDEVVKIVRNSDSKDDAKRSIIKLLGIDAEQAEAILALQLGRLTRLDVNDIDVKIREAEKQRQLQLSIIGTKSVRDKIIIDTLAKLRKQFGDERRTTIITEEPKIEDVIESVPEEYVVLGHDGQMYHVSGGELQSQFKKGGRYAKIDIRQCIFNYGQPVHILNADGSLSEYRTTTTGSLFRFDNSKQYILTISANGIMKKTLMTEYRKLDRLCKVKDGDSIIAAFCVNENDSIMIHTPEHINRIPVTNIKTSSKLTIGTKQSVKPILNVWVATQFFYTVNSDLQVKRTLSTEINSIVLLNNGCTTCGSVEDNNYINYDGKYVNVLWSSVSIKSKNSDGAKLTSKNFKA